MTTQALIDAYKRAQLEIIARIERRPNAGSMIEYEAMLFADIEAILGSLGADTKKWLSSAVPAVYRSAVTDTYRQLGMTPVPGASFTGVHEEAVRGIVEEAQAGMDAALYQIARHLNDQIREASIKAMEAKPTTTQTIGRLQEDLIRTFREQGYVTGVPDSRGRMMDTRAYVEMMTRTTTREAANTATINAAHELGCHLFKMNTHFPTCKICAPRQGRVYRDIDFPEDDERNRFPHIAKAFPGWPGYRNVHPRCHHVIAALDWLSLSRKMQRKYLSDADRPFDVDPRSEKEIAAYNYEQALKREMREDRKQWERYRARLGEDAPKSFAAFRRIKNAGGEKFRKLQEAYRKVRVPDDQQTGPAEW